MLKVPLLLQLCHQQRNQARKNILRLLSQYKVTTRKSSTYPSTDHRPASNSISRFNVDVQLLASASFCSSASSDIDTMVKSVPGSDNTEKKEELYRIVKFLKSRGCTSADIRNRCLPHLMGSQNAYLKTILISVLHPDIASLMPLMSHSVSSLRLAAKVAKIDGAMIDGFSNRISYLCHHLETPLDDMVSALTKHSALLTMPFDKLERKMNIMKAAEIEPRYITKDLWIFNYKEEQIAQRIYAAQKAGVELKPWILRCSIKTFNLMIKKNSEINSVLKGDDEIGYLAKRLDCSKEYVEYLIEQNKSLTTIAVPKLDRVLNFLFEKGYTPSEVRIFPRVFGSSVETLRKRFDAISALKSTMPTMSQLCLKSKSRAHPSEEQISSQ